MKNISLKKRILIPLTLALILLVIVFIANTYRIEYEEISVNVEKKLGSVQELFEKELDSDIKIMGVINEMLSANPELQAAWLLKDRKELLNLSSKSSVNPFSLKSTC